MRVVALGELLLRLKSPGAQRLMQGLHLEAGYGGSEFNVLASLARLSATTEFVTTLPENPLGSAAVATVAGHGVGTQFIRRAPGRLGLYFLESGSGVRRPKVLYDRAGSAFALTPPAGFDWPAILKGADCLHSSGITPAVSEQAAAIAVAGARAATAANVRVSLDINMRPALWAACGRDPVAALAPLLNEARILFATPADAAVCLPAAARPGANSQAGFAAALFAQYPKLEVLVSGAKRGTSATDFELLATRPVPRICRSQCAGDPGALGRREHRGRRCPGRRMPLRATLRLADRALAGFWIGCASLKAHRARGHQPGQPRGDRRRGRRHLPPACPALGDDRYTAPRHRLSQPRLSPMVISDYVLTIPPAKIHDLKGA